LPGRRDPEIPQGLRGCAWIAAQAPGGAADITVLPSRT
jgi:hypothetical protein